MSSSESEVEVESNNNNKIETDDISKFLVQKMKEHKFLLEKSMLPSIKNKKKQTIETCVKEMKQIFGIEITGKNILKKISNMKCRIKNKIDLNKTRNKKIILKKWETDLSQLLCVNSNPSTNKLPVHLSLGTNDNCTRDTLEETSATITSESKTTATSLAKEQRKRPCADDNDHPVNKKSTAVLSRYETDETRELNFQSLQRLVLLKHNKVLSAKMQILQEKRMGRNLQFHEF